MLTAPVLRALTRLLCGAQARYVDCAPTGGQAIYFANHTSHLDTLALWAALPLTTRWRTRPVAAKDYWGTGFIKRFIAVRGLHAVLLERETVKRDMLAPVAEALEAGDSLIIFPEGTRRAQRLPSPFKSGLYRLAKSFPDVDLVPVYIENLHRCMPKGSLVPVPLVCTVRFGAPLQRIPDESRDDFLTRARQAVEALA